jgi:hypothetical protein
MNLAIGDLVVVSKGCKSKLSGDMLAIVLEVRPSEIFETEAVYKLQSMAGHQIWAASSQLTLKKVRKVNV